MPDTPVAVPASSNSNEVYVVMLDQADAIRNINLIEGDINSRKSDQIKNLPDHEEKQKILKRLGITDMQNDDKIVVYSDRVQTIIFKGKLSDKDKTLTLTESIPFQIATHSRSGIAAVADKVLEQIKTISFKPLGKPIIIDASHTEKRPYNTEIKLNDDQIKDLETRATLSSLANKAMDGLALNPSSNASLPLAAKMGGKENTRT